MTLLSSVPIFAAMPDRNDHDLVTNNLIQNNIGPAPKLNNPFPIIRRHILDETSDLWITSKGIDPHSNRFDGATSRTSALLRKKST